MGKKTLKIVGQEGESETDACCGGAAAEESGSDC